MARINVTRLDSDNEYDDGPRVHDGWFDPDRADLFHEGRVTVSRPNGVTNRVGACSGHEFIDETLYFTSGGRWVLHRDEHRCNAGPNIYTFIEPEQARLWLIRSTVHDDAVALLFGPIPEESGPTVNPRAIGAPTQIRFAPEVTAELDKRAAELLISRAELVRRLVTAGLQETSPIEGAHYAR